MSQGRNRNESWGRVTPASPLVRKTPRLPPCQRRSLSPNLGTTTERKPQSTALQCTLPRLRFAHFLTLYNGYFEHMYQYDKVYRYDKTIFLVV
jgi:hypothetical protein